MHTTDDRVLMPGRSGEAEVTGPQVELVLSPHDMPDLAPAIHRQRLVVEGEPAAPIEAGLVRDYLRELTAVCGMVPLMEPVTHRSDRYGWAGWIHWETSGAHFYAWEQPKLFFSVDVYACKPFDARAVAEFTARRFGADRVVATGF